MQNLQEMYTAGWCNLSVVFSVHEGISLCCERYFE